MTMEQYGVVRSLYTLFKNQKLLNLYEQPCKYGLYKLNKQSFPNSVVQDDYNHLHSKFRYFNVILGLPLCMLVIKPHWIKYLQKNE